MQKTANCCSRIFMRCNIPKPFLVLKLTFLLLTIAMLHVGASGLSQSISFSGRDVPLEKIFAAVKKQTGYVFFYDLSVVQNAAPVTVDAKNLPLESFLQLVFKDGRFKYTIQGSAIVVTVAEGGPAVPNPPAAERVPVTGRVTDQNGNPLTGATLAMKWENGIVSIVTDAGGKFSFLGPVGQTVEVSYVGYKSFRFTITRQTREVNIVLSEYAAVMNEVTVSTGYQTLSRTRSTGAISRVEGEDIRDKSVSTNVIDLLEGQVQGLAVNYGEGSDKFLIRGVNSVNANRSPLYVLDGIPISYDDVSRLINPNDVDNIQVLRDATAASIWGAQAANGVVVITTKKGKLQGHVKVQYDGYVSFKGLPDYSYQKMMNSSQFIQAAKQVFDPATYPWDYVTTLNQDYQIPVVFPHEQIQYDLSRGVISPAVADQRMDSLAALNNRSQIEKNLLQPALLTNHSLSLSGGNPFYSFYGSFNYTSQKNTDRSNQDNYMLNLRQSFAFTKSIKLDLITNVSQQVSKQFVIPYLSVLNTYLPYAMFKDGNGNALSQSYMRLYSAYQKNAEDLSGISLDYVPLDEASHTRNNSNKTLTARVNAGLTVNFLKKFTFEGRYQYESGNNSNYLYYDQDSYYTRRELVNFTEPGPVYHLPSQGGDYFTGSGTATSWDVRNQFTYNNSWDVHDLTVLAGTEISDKLSRSSTNLLRGYDFQTMTYTPYDENSLRTNGVADPIIPNQYVSSYLSDPTYTQQESEVRFFSLYGNLAYAFKKKYNLNASIRTDQSNLFGADISQQYKPIWSVGGSWQIDREAFYHSSWMNNLKLRVTYGIGGNSPNPGSGGPYEIIQPWPSTFYSNVGQGYSILLPSNKKLTWERTATLNAGADIGILESRVTFSLDVYHKQTSNLLGYSPFDPTNGWPSGYTNLGNIDNKGIEAAVRSLNVAGKDFSWTTVLNFGYNKNKVVKLGQTVPLTAEGKLNSLGFVEGYSAYSMFAVKYAGLDNQGDPQIYTRKGDKIKMSSDLTLDDVNYAGTTQPSYYGGLTNTFRYKSWQLSFFIVYNLGYKMRSYTDNFFSGRLITDINKYFNDRWQHPGDENKTNVPRYISSAATDVQTRSIEFYDMADINVESASYAKMRDLTLSYNLPRTWTDKLSMSLLRIYAQVNNVLLWRANKQGIDPEYNNLQNGAGGGSGAGSSFGQILGSLQNALPNKMKPFLTFGLNVSFK